MCPWEDVKELASWRIRLVKRVSALWWANGSVGSVASRMEGFMVMWVKK